MNPFRGILFMGLLCLAAPYSFGQIAFWQLYLGGTAFDKGKKLLYQADGTLIIGGETQSTNGLGTDNHSSDYDIVVFKYATQGKRFWKTMLGSRGTERLGDMIEVGSDGLLLVGSSNSSGDDVPSNAGGSDIWVVRLSGKGEILWTRSFGGRGDDLGLAALRTQDGGFLIGGESGSINHSANPEVRHHGGLDSWVAKLDAAGNLEWELLMGGSRNEQVCSLHQLPNGNYIVVHNANSEDADLEGLVTRGGKDIWITQLTERGKLVSQALYGGNLNDDIYASALESDGTLWLGGTTFSDNGDIDRQQGQGDCWVMKLSPMGEVTWSHTYGGPRPDGINDMLLTQDGGAVFCGITRSRTGEGDIEANKGYYDGWLVKIDSMGQRKWSRTIGYEGKDELNSLVQVPNGGFVALGSAIQDRNGIVLPGHSGMSDLWMVNFDNLDRNQVRAYVTPPLLFGKVLDGETDVALQADIILTDNQTLDSLTSASTSPQGEFIMTLPSYGLVSINILSEGYLFYGRDIRMDTVSSSKTSTEQVYRLEPIRMGASLTLDRLYFETGKWDLLPASNAELERLIAFLELNTGVWIQINGHTDNTGNPADKLELSLNRAESVRAYLIQRGIDRRRLRVKGYGMSRPRASNSTSEGRRANRRVEFEVIKE